MRSHRTRGSASCPPNRGHFIEALVPPRHEPWVHYADAGPDWEGWEGFIQDPRQTDRLADALRRVDVSS
jgi:hypothetical protein